ncbi:ankyrin repeat protein [Megavirus baoshan]|uniref:Ankyrin repeat protein n=1 Tax=Megavirus baoshan TaxID=2496520 RepID=A0A3Q8U8M5_9VIRU|nr:ankyrin repeat protein [Megavirus baoshan]AZL89594.1 ankyrin repeat protein [Megavirus baoshan]
MKKHTTYILTQVKTLSPIPVIDEDISNIEENIKSKLDKILKKLLIKWMKKDFCLISIDDDDDDDYDDYQIVNLQVDKKNLNIEIKKNLDSVTKTIIYDYINIKCRQEYIDGNREKAMSYFQHIDVNYNYFKNSNNYKNILDYAISKEDTEVIKIILGKKPNDFYKIRETNNFEIIGLYIDYICDNKIGKTILNDDGNFIFYDSRPNNQKEFICKHPRAKEFLGIFYDDIAKNYFNNNF